MAADRGSGKLSEAQKRGLTFLAKAPWESVWWGGRPYCGWPKELNGRSFDSMHARGLVSMGPAANVRRTVVKITPVGRAALASHTKAG